MNTPLPTASGPSTLVPHPSARSSQLKAVQSPSRPFADKARLLESLVRPFRFLRRRRAGKIAHLAPPVRQQINLLLRDGLPYAAIIAQLGEAGHRLNKDNLSRWRKADYQDWLAEQSWLEALEKSPLARPQ